MVAVKMHVEDIEEIIGLILHNVEMDLMYICFAGSRQSMDGEYYGPFFKVVAGQEFDELNKDLIDLDVELSYACYPSTVDTKPYEKYGKAIVIRQIYSLHFTPLIREPLIKAKLEEYIRFKDATKMLQTTKHGTTFGIKLYPLLNIHKQNMLPIHCPYNELYVLQVINRLYFGGHITTSSVYFGNVIINELRHHVFRNHTMYEKFIENDKAIKRMEALRLELLSLKDETIREQTQQLMDNLQNFSMMANETIIIVEYHLMFVTPQTDLLNALADYSVFEMQGYWFSILYFMYVLSVNSILHTDLHYGNVIPQYRNAINQFVVCEMPKSSISGGGDERIERNYFRDLELPNDDPVHPSYEHGLNRYILPYMYRHIVPIVIDFSRAIVFDPSKFAGIHPYKSQLLDIQYRRLHQALYVLLEEFKCEKIINEQYFVDLCMEYIEEVFAAIIGFDVYLYLRNLRRDVGKWRKPGVADAFDAFLTDMRGVLEARITMLDHGELDVMRTLENPYLKWCEQHCDLLMKRDSFEAKGTDVWNWTYARYCKA